MAFHTLRLSALALLAATAFASPALGRAECPAGQSVANPLKGAPTSPKGVTDTVIGSIDLGPESRSPTGSCACVALWCSPAGSFRSTATSIAPRLIYTVSGTIIEYRSNCAVPITHKPDDIAREADGISHYWVNKGNVPVVLLSADVHHGK